MEAKLTACRVGNPVICAVLAAGAAALVAGCGPDPLTKQQLLGLALYKERCAHCHEENDLALKKAPPDLHHIFERDRLPSGAPATDEAVRRNILVGRGMMPGFEGRFTEEQMTALLAYLHTGLH